MCGIIRELDFMTFTDLSLPPELIAALSKQQIFDPSPIQIAAIPPLVAGRMRICERKRVLAKHWLICCPSLCASILRKLRPSRDRGANARISHSDSPSIL